MPKPETLSGRKIKNYVFIFIQIVSGRIFSTEANFEFSVIAVYY